jgi:hypothetical protein
MYGMVNKAIQDLVTSNFGEDKWLSIKEKVGFEDDFFISMQSYPDELTYDLVGAASEVLELEPAAILEAFGEYWILYTAEEGYGEMLALSGSTLSEFLGNLNLLHERITNIMPQLKPPKFSSKEISKNNIELTYESDREGLTSMVVGLLRGLGKRFGKNCQINQTEFRADSGKDVFNISW